MTAVLAWLARLPAWAWIAAAAALVIAAQWAALSHTRAELADEEQAHEQTTTAFAAYRRTTEAQATAEALARQQREDAYRDREAQITRDANKRIQAANAAARAVRADAERLRQQAAHLAAAARGRAVQADTPAAHSPPGAGRADLLADMLGRCAGRHAELAIVADRARSAGAECEARYDSAAALTGQ